MSTANVDVLIIGAGPAGVMCANALATYGVSVRIIDQRPLKVAAGQADGIQPRTIEVLQSYGLAERLLREGNQMHMAAFYNPGPNGIELTERVPDVTAPTARFPFEVTLHQGAIESIFLDSMAKKGVLVERPVIPTDLKLVGDPSNPNDYAVQVQLKHLDSNSDQPVQTIRAKFVVGCDGAHSWVRKALGIEMEGEQTDYVWGVVDMVPGTDFPDIRNRCAIHSTNGSCMVIPREGNKVRLYIQLEGKDAVDATNGRVDKTRLGPEQLLKVAQKSMKPYTLETPDSFDWWTIYIIGQRVASRFSVDNRIFIAGDACHTHSPKAGQGMNASMNDTHNLAWKLAHVIKGWAKMDILDTYEFERRQYAQDLINFDKKFAKLFSGKPQSELHQDGVSHVDFLQIFQTFGGFTSGIGVHYAPSSIVAPTPSDSPAKNITIGQRMVPGILIRAADFRPYELHDLLPSDGRLKLLVFCGDVTDPTQNEKLQRISVEIESVLEKYTPTASRAKVTEVEINGMKIPYPQNEVFEIISISSAKKATVRYNTLPAVLRSHWSKVFIDDVDAAGRVGGQVYSSFGISSVEGAIILIRPDGYVGTVLRLDDTENLRDYLGRFLVSTN